MSNETSPGQGATASSAGVKGNDPKTGESHELKRVMGPGLLLLFIVGDILGTGIYAVTGNVAKEVGGVVWLPFLVAFLVALVTAFSYLELVTKYPQAAGAALYTHKAFGIHFVTFLVAFAVMCSGITSASTASSAFAGFLRDGIGTDWKAGSTPLLLIALGFMALVAAPEGVAVFQKSHPDVKVYTASLDSHLDENAYIVPGLGDAGDRMFGTK